MRDELEHMKYEAGYPGEDSMRAKAERLMKEELMKTPMHLPASHSTPSHEKMRLYKKGGHVTKKAHHRDGHKEHERAKLHKMQHHGLEMAEKGLSKERRLKRGGYAHKETLERRSDLEAGGHLTNLHIPRKEKLSIQSVKEAEALRKGGSVHHAKHEHDHHKHRVYKAAGGTIYEKHMLGEHSSHKRPHINYESEMKGEHCMHHAKAGHYTNAGAFDASKGQYKKHGGRVKEHTRKRMAAGGAAKVRHGVATPSGRPIMRKSPKGY